MTVFPCVCVPSDDRSAELFQKRIDTATQMKSVLGAHERPNCLVIDEIDGAPSVSLWQGQLRPSSLPAPIMFSHQRAH